MMVYVLIKNVYLYFLCKIAIPRMLNFVEVVRKNLMFVGPCIVNQCQ